MYKRKVRRIDGRKGVYKMCLVGYTNSGKSTLLNRLTGSSVYVEDKLFATLDTRTKKWTIEGAAEILLSDTVGFVRDLPHQLVASFKALLDAFRCPKCQSFLRVLRDGMSDKAVTCNCGQAGFNLLNKS